MRSETRSQIQPSKMPSNPYDFLPSSQQYVPPLLYFRQSPAFSVSYLQLYLQGFGKSISYCRPNRFPDMKRNPACRILRLRRVAQATSSIPPQCDPRGAFLCHRKAISYEIKKNGCGIYRTRKVRQNQICGPAATRAFPASLPSYFAKFLMNLPARSFALVSHSEASA